MKRASKIFLPVLILVLLLTGCNSPKKDNVRVFPVKYNSFIKQFESKISSFHITLQEKEKKEYADGLFIGTIYTMQNAPEGAELEVWTYRSTQKIAAVYVSAPYSDENLRGYSEAAFSILIPDFENSVLDDIDTSEELIEIQETQAGDYIYRYSGMGAVHKYWTILVPTE